MYVTTQFKTDPCTSFILIIKNVAIEISVETQNSLRSQMPKNSCAGYLWDVCLDKIYSFVNLSGLEFRRVAMCKPSFVTSVLNRTKIHLSIIWEDNSDSLKWLCKSC